MLRVPSSRALPTAARRTAAGAEDADQRELRGAGEHQQRHRHRLPRVQPGGVRSGAERRPVETDGQPEPEGVAQGRGAGGGHSGDTNSPLSPAGSPADRNRLVQLRVQRLGGREEPGEVAGAAVGVGGPVEQPDGRRELADHHGPGAREDGDPRVGAQSAGRLPRERRERQERAPLRRPAVEGVGEVVVGDGEGVVQERRGGRRGRRSCCRCEASLSWRRLWF